MFFEQGSQLGEKETKLVLKTGMSFTTGRGPERGGCQDFCFGAHLRIGVEGKTRSWLVQSLERWAACVRGGRQGSSSSPRRPQRKVSHR